MAYRRSRQKQNESPNTTQNAGNPQYNLFNLQRAQNQNETKEVQERQQVKPPINETYLKPQNDGPSKALSKEAQPPTDIMEGRDIKRVVNRNPFQRSQNPNKANEVQERQQGKPPINETHVKPHSDSPSKSGNKEEKNPTDRLEYRNPFNLQRGQYQKETKELQERQQVQPPVKPQYDGPSRAISKEGQHPTDIMEGRDIKRVVNRNPFQRRPSQSKTNEVQERQQANPPLNATHVKPQTDSHSKSGTKEEKNPLDRLEYRNPFNLQRGQYQNETKELQERQKVKPPINDGPSKAISKEGQHPTDIMEGRDIKRVVNRNPFQRRPSQSKTNEVQERQQANPLLNATYVKPQTDSHSKSGTKEENQDVNRVMNYNPFQRRQNQKITQEIHERQQANPPLNATQVKPQSDGHIRRSSKENQQPSNFMEFRHVKGVVLYNPYGLQPNQYQNEAKELQAKPPLKATPEKPQPDLPPKVMKEAGEQKKVDLPLKPIPEKAQSDLPVQSPSKGMKEAVEQKKVEVPRRETLRKSQPNLRTQSASKDTKEVNLQKMVPPQTPPRKSQLVSKGTKEVDVQKRPNVSIKATPETLKSDLPTQSASKGIKEAVEQKKVEVPRRETLRKSQPNLPPQSASKGMKEVVDQKKVEVPPQTTPRKSQYDLRQSASKGMKEVGEQKKVEVPHRETLRKSQPNLPPQSASKEIREENVQKKAEVPPQTTPSKPPSDLRQSASRGMKEVGDQKRPEVPPKATPTKPQSDPRQSASKGMKEVGEQKKVEVPRRITLRVSHLDLPAQSAPKGMKEVDEQKKAKASLQATSNKSQSNPPPQPALKGVKEVGEQKKVEVPQRITLRKSHLDLPSQSAPKGMREGDAQKKAEAPPKTSPTKSQAVLPPQSAPKEMKEVGEQKRPKESLKPTLRNPKSDSTPKPKPKPSPPKQKAAASSSQLPSTKLPPQQSPSGNQPSRKLNQPSTPGQVNRKKCVRQTKQGVSGIGQRPKTQRQPQPASKTLYPRRPLHWPKIDYSQLHQQPTKKRRVLRRVYVGTNNWESVQLQKQLQLESAASQNPYNVCIREQYHQYLSNSNCEGSCHTINPSGPSSMRDSPIPRGKRHSHRSIC